MTEDTATPLNRAERRRRGWRSKGAVRVGTLASGTVMLTTGLFGGYLGNPRLPRAYAFTTPCTTTATPTAFVGTQAELDDALQDPECTSISLTNNITLTSSLTTVGDASWPASGARDGNTGLTISGNGYAIDGAAFAGFAFNLTGNTSDRHLSFSDVTLSGFSGIKGAALYFRSSSTAHSQVVSLYNVTMSNNTAAAAGGAVYLYANRYGSLETTDSAFTGNTATGNGGAVYVRARGISGNGGADLTVIHSTFTSNSSSGSGGAAAVRTTSRGYGTVSVDWWNGSGDRPYASYFTNNTAALNGGAIWTSGIANYGPTVDIYGNAHFMNNGAIGKGGAIYLTGSGGGLGVGDAYPTPADPLTDNPAVFANNGAGVSGGAIYSNQASMTLVNADLAYNYAVAGSGGAIYAGTNTGVALKSVSMTHNTAAVNGGAIASKRQSVSIENSTLASNTATGSGGGVFTAVGSVLMTNSTLDGNTATAGNGGALNVAAASTMHFSTLTGNIAGGTGGAVYSKFSPMPTEVQYSVLWGNDSAGRDDVYAAGSVNMTYSSYESSGTVYGQGGTNIDSHSITGDPLLGGLTSKGGSYGFPTPVRVPADNSPVVNRIAAATVAANGAVNTLTSDQRVRPSVYHRVAGKYADMGAVEVRLTDAIDSGDGQTGTVSTELAAPIKVKVTGEGGTGVPRAGLNFAVAPGEGGLASTSGGATTESVDLQTDADGLATAWWTLGATVGAQTTTATGYDSTYPTLTFTATGATPAPTPPPNPGGGSSSTPSPSTPTVVTPSTPQPLGPNEGPGASRVPQGGSLVTVGGVPTPTSTSKDGKAGTQTTTGDGWQLTVGGRGPGGKPQPSARGGVVQLPRGGGVLVRGSGYVPGTTVVVYALNPAIQLGTLTVGPDGTFQGTLPLPASLVAGSAVLQVNGYTPDMQVRSTSLGVRVVADKTGTVHTLSSTVYFASGSSALSADSRAELAKVAASVPKGATGVRIASVGYVQGTSDTSNDFTLSTQRATAVADQLKKDKLKGEYLISGRGVARESGAKGRKVVVTITYRS